MQNAKRKTLAYKAISIHPSLSSAEKTIAASLVEHLNLDSGRCDPGAKRLAIKSGYSVSTVKKCISKICSPELGLFNKRSRGGNYGTNQYAINWPEVHLIIDEFEARGKPPKSRELEHKGNPDQGINRYSTSTSPDTQNHSKNYFKNSNNDQNPSTNAKPESPRKRNGDTYSNSRAKLKAEIYSNLTTMSFEQHQIREKMLETIGKDSPLFKERCECELNVSDWVDVISKETKKPGEGIDTLKRRLGF